MYLTTSEESNMETQPKANTVENTTSNSKQRRRIVECTDAAVLLAAGLERTNNNFGFMFLQIDEDVLRPWLSSLPDSERPLADLGACYGVNTIHALKRGRNVVALDADASHISTLRERVSQTQTRGNLVDAVTATLPCGKVFEECSFAGVLLSEVLHMLPLGTPQQLFNDIYKWLVPGGTLLVTTCSAQIMNKEVGKKFVLRGDITRERALQLVKDEPDDIVQLAPAFVEIPWAWNLDYLYLMTKKEVRNFAEMAGLTVQRCEYITQTKYDNVYTMNENENSSVLLVGKKPISV